MLERDVVAPPMARLRQRFFSQSSRLAGEPTQKVVTYRLKPVVVGDLSSCPVAGPAPRARRRAEQVRPARSTFQRARRARRGCDPS
ncbi:DUF4180 domain-containing protein [Streptosporangium sp. NPDC006930]|uniref:DUF4180 domain-containing protein n=1 Tax=Streptosporangium sp. NPDC006930 TaxID=3154783 RepID=UPI00341FB7EB